MPNRTRRATADRRLARRRAQWIADRYGRTLRECRTALRLTQAAASARAGVSQPFWSSLERGEGTTASLETLAACAAAVDAQFAGFIEARPGAELPRDIEHLRRQELIVRVAAGGGWRGGPERPLESTDGRRLSVDVQLERATLIDREVAIVEIEDWLGDVGAAWRNLGDKVAAAHRSAAQPARVAGLLIVRATQRNRRIVTELGALFDARFPATGVDWLRGLTRPGVPMPMADGRLWSSVDGRRLIAPRRAELRQTASQRRRSPVA